MNTSKTRSIKAALLMGVTLLLLVQAPDPLAMRAGEPVRVGGPTTFGFGPEGVPIVFGALPISYRTDGGNLGILNNAGAVALTDSLFQVWENVPTSSVDFTNAGSILTDAGAAACVPDGDVDTLAEFNCLQGAFFPGSPIIYDADGSLFAALGRPISVLGFAGPVTSSDGTNATFIRGFAAINGIHRDGIDTPPGNPESTQSEFEATLLHEFGHLLGLGHSQININCLAFVSCANFSDDTFGLPTMFPISISGLEESAGVAPESTLSLDDIAWVSRLYPDPNAVTGFAATHGTISGTVFFSDGATHLQGVNLIARSTVLPRRNAVSGVSGYLYTGNRGLGSGFLNESNGAALNQGNSGGARDATLRGTYDIPVPAGVSYNISVEAVDPSFVSSSSVGSLGRHAGETFGLPGPAPAAINGVGPIVANTTSGGNNFIFTPTAATRDSFDALATNDTTTTATPITNGTTSASISPFGNVSATEPDVDVYTFNAVANTTATFETFARRLVAPPIPSTLNSVLEIVNASGTRLSLCDTAVDAIDGIFDDPCMNDDITLGTVLDSRLSFQSPTAGQFFLRVLDERGDARPDMLYDLVVTGAGQAPPPAGCTSDFDQGGASNDWNTATNWNPDGLPTGTSNVCIGATFAVDHAGTDTINSLADVAGDLNITGGTLTVTSSVAVGGSLNIVGGTLNAPASNISSLTMTSGAANFAGPVASILGLTFNGGTLSATSGTVTLPAAGYTHAGGTLRLNGGSVGTAGTITQTGGLIEGGTPGTLTANINQTGGTIGPGLSSGILNVTGNFTQTAGGIIQLEIGGTGGPGAANGHDQINITGNATTDGTFNVVLINAFTPSLGNSFTVATASGATAGNNALNLPALGGGLAFTDANSTANALILDVITASACTINFDNSAGTGLWQTATNWDNDTLPINTDNVCIGAGFTVTKSAAGGNSINSLAVDNAAGVFTLSGSTLSIAAASTIGTGGMTQPSGTFSGAGSLSISGAFNWSGGTQLGPGTTTVSSPLIVSGNVTLDARTLRNNGNAISTTVAVMFLTNSGIFENNGTVTADATNGSITGTGTVNNFGSFVRDVSATDFVISAPFNNFGSVTVNTGTLRLNSVGSCGGSCAGTWSADAGATLQLNGGTASLTGNISGAGIVKFSGTADVTLDGGTYNVSGSTVSDAAIRYTQFVNLADMGRVEVRGSLDLSSGEAVNLTDLNVISGTLSGSDTITIGSGGTFTWDSGILGPGGKVIIGFAALANILFGPGTVTLDGRTLTNNGTINWANSGWTLLNNAVINNNGTVNAQNLSPLSGGSGTFNNNSGGIFNQTGMSGSCLYSAVFNNNTGGTVNITGNASNIQFGGGGSCGGTCGGNRTIGPNATATYTSGVYDLSGVISGAGSWRVAGGTVNFTGTLNITGTTGISSGTLNFLPASTVTSVGTLQPTGGTVNFSSGDVIMPVGAVTQSLATVTGSDTVTITGLLTWNSGTQSGTGTTNANGGVTMSAPVLGRFITGRTFNNTGTATVSGSGGLTIGGGGVFNNSGTFDLQNDADITFTAGTRTINNSGTFVKSNGAASSSVGPVFNNTGTVNANSGLLSFNTNFTQTAGSTTLNGGNIAIAVGIAFDFNGGVLDAVGGSTIIGNVSNAGATVRPGLSPGTLNITGNYTQSGTGILDVELGGFTAGTQYDVMAITGSATLAGTLNVQPFAAFVPSGNFQIMTFASLSGDFTTKNNTTAGTGFATTPGATNYEVSFAVTACNINAAGSGDWATAATWSPATVPGASDNPCIGGAFAVTVSTAGQAANSLTVTSTAPFTISGGGALDLASASTIGAGGFNQSGGILSGAGSLTINGPFAWSGGTQGGGGITNANGGMNITGGATFNLINSGRVLNNAAAATWTGASSSIDNLGGAVFNNLLGASFDIQNDAAWQFAGGGQFNNAGTLTKSAGAGTSTIGVPFNNTGTVNANSGALSLNSTSTSTAATFNVSATLRFASGTNTLDAASSISGAGTVNFFGGTTDINGTYNITGASAFNNGTANFNASSTVTSIGALTISSGTANFSSGNIITPVGAMTQSGGTLTGTDTVTIAGLFTWSGGTQGGGGITNANGGMNITGGATFNLINSGRVLNNAAAATWTGASSSIDNLGGAVFNNLLGASFDIQNDAAWQFAGGGQFNNAGTLTKSAGAGTTTIGVGFSNTNTVNANSGTLRFTNAFTQTAGLTSLNGGNVSATVTLNFNGGFLSAINGSTITANVNNAGSSVQPGTSPGTLNINGNYTQGPGGVLNIELGGTGAGQFDVLAITGTATLDGILNVQSFGGFSAGAGVSFQVMTYGSRTGDFATKLGLNIATPPLIGLPQATFYLLSNAVDADMSVTKTDLPDPVTAGQSVTYTITVTNNGPGPATSAVLNDPLPASTTFVSFAAAAGWTCTTPAVGANGTVNCTNPSVAAAASDVFTLVAATTGASVPSISNTATVGATQNDPTPANNSATAATAVNGVADLAVTKADAPDPVNVGNNLTYTVTVTNNGPNDATNVVLTDNLPANSTFVSATPSQGTCPAPAAGVLTCNLGAVNNGANATVAIVVTPQAAAVPSISGTSSVTAAENDPTPANNSVTEPTAVQAQADLAVTKTDAPDPVRVGNNLTYTVTVSNNGLSAATNVVLTDTLPANVTFVSATAPCTQAAGTVTCNLGTINSGANSVVTIVVTPQVAAVPSINNVASVGATEFDPNAANNAVSQTTTVDPVADLAVTKTDAPDPVTVGNNLTYTVTVTNNGPNDATSVVLTDTLPANVTFVSATAPCTPAAGVVTCNLGTINNGANTVITIVVTPLAAAAPSVTNSASVTAAEFDSNAANSTNITQATAVTPVADVAITATDSPDPVNAGSNITYTVTVTNNGPSPATNIVATTTPPAGLTFVSAVASQGSCAFAAGTLTCNVGTLANAATATATVVVTAGAAAVPAVTLTANVTATESDPTAANNSVSVTTTVNAAADLAVTKSDTPDPVVVSTNLTYNVTVVNNGPSTATAVVLTDTLPGTVTYVSATPSQGGPCTQAAGTVTCNLGTINNGANATVAIVVTAPNTPGSISNTASATSGVTDPTAANNSATQGTTVNSGVVADFSLGAAPPVQAVFAGLSTGYIVTVTPSGGFTGNVALTCSVNAPLATCTITPTPVSITGTTAVTATVTVSTTARGTMIPRVPPPSLPPFDFRVLLPWLCVLMAFATWLWSRKATRQRTWVVRALPVVLIVMLSVFAYGCAQHIGAPGTSSGTYGVTVTATSGALSHSTSATLVVR